MSAPAKEGSDGQIALRLQRLRKHLGYDTHAAFAAACGLTRTAYTQYEAGSRRLTIDAAKAICRTTHVTLDWLYFGEIHGLPAMLRDLPKESGQAA